MIPKPIRPLATVAAVITGGLITLNLASTATIKAIRFVSEAKRRKVALPCGVCRGKGFYICKLCNGNATIEWSPMYDPVAINPCLCPTCEGNRLLEVPLPLVITRYPSPLMDRTPELSINEFCQLATQTIFISL
ncbi:hypothetical protein ACB092_01G347100 [Castanea dentata]